MSSTYRVLCLSHDPAIATSSAFKVAEDISRRGCWSRQRLDRLRHELADAP